MKNNDSCQKWPQHLTPSWYFNIMLCLKILDYLSHYRQQQTSNWMYFWSIILSNGQFNKGADGEMKWSAVVNEQYWYLYCEIIIMPVHSVLHCLTHHTWHARRKIAENFQIINNLTITYRSHSSWMQRCTNKSFSSGMKTKSITEKWEAKCI